MLRSAVPGRRHDWRRRRTFPSSSRAATGDRVWHGACWHILSACVLSDGRRFAQGWRLVSAMDPNLNPAAPFGLALPRFPPGEVWLAGAGPGDPGLLTLHVANALSQAEVILYDAL